MTALPATECLLVAVTTPVTPDFSPDAGLLIARCRQLIADGCHGVTLFGTTGEGAEFAVDDRMAALEAVIAGGIAPERIVVSIGALSIPDIARLARHAIDRRVDGLLLMPPCVYRSGITEDGAFRFYEAVIERIARPELRLYLYHFPDISGVAVTPQVIRRLDERYPGTIAGVKDSGGDLGFTETLLRRFSHLSIFTGTEIHLPQALAIGARGTICGLGNVMPRLMRGLFDQPTSFDRQKLVPFITSGDSILSRAPFVASVKAVVADATGNDAWARVLPPMAGLPLRERQWMLQDFRRWEASLPAEWRSMYGHGNATDSNVVAIRRA